MRWRSGRATPRSRRVLAPNERRWASSSRLDRRRLAGRAAPRSAVPLRRCVGGSFQRLRLPLGLRSPAAPAEPDEDHYRVVTEGRQPSCSSMKPLKRPAGERGVHSSSKGGPPGGGRRKCGRRARPCSRELLTVEAQLTRPNLQKKVASGSRRLFAEPWRALWPPAKPRNAVRVAAGCRHGPAAVDCREPLRDIVSLATSLMPEYECIRLK